MLHRDLKPRNIMLGTFGETVVIDWGLAKPVGRPEHLKRPDDDGTLRPSSAGRSDATRSGSAIGTPSYISPEQARGEVERLGPGCDVFGLGVTLYCLLTGRAPYAGPDTEAILDRALRLDFEPPRALLPEIPPSLEARRRDFPSVAGLLLETRLCRRVVYNDSIWFGCVFSLRLSCTH